MNTLNLKDGMKIACVINGTIIEDARIRKLGRKIYICQNLRDGDNPPTGDKLGYLYSWSFYEDRPEACNVYGIKIIDDDKLYVNVGDIVILGIEKRRILETLENSCLMSFDKKYEEAGVWITYKELKKDGYKIENRKEENDDVTITVEGKNIVISRKSAKALGLVK